MKKKSIICCIIVVTLILGIGMLLLNNKTVKKYSLNDEIRLHIKEKAKVEDLNIVLSSISDSTCPKDVQCIWQGEYSYELLINNEKVTLGTVTAREYLYKDYNIILSDNSSKDYIQFTINKK